MNLKRGIYYSFMIIILFFTGLNLYGETLKLTLEEAIALGLKNSSSLQAKNYALQAAIAELKAAEAGHYPNISASASWTHLFDQPKTSDMTIDMGGTGAFTIPGSYMSASDPISVSLSVSQSIYAGGRVKTSIEMSKKKVEMARLDLQEEKRKLIVQIKKAFYGYILAKDVKEVVKETLNNKLESLNVAKKRFNAGLVPDYEVLSAETDVESFMPQVISAENQVKYALLSVKELLGIKEKEDFDIELVGKLEAEDITYDENKLLSMALDHKYDVLQFKSNLEILKLVDRLNRASKLPAVSAFVSYSLESGYDSTTGENKYWGKDSWSDNLTCGLSVMVPLSSLFPWSSENAKIKQGEFNISEAKTGFDSLKSGIKLQIKNLLLRLEEEKAKIKSGEKSIELATKLYNSSKERYSKGLISRLDLSNSEIKLNNVKIGYLTAVYNYKLAVFDLMDVVGVDNL